MKIVIDIKDCRGCPHHMATPYPTDDSYERPEYWWCKASDGITSNEYAEQIRLSIKKNNNLSNLRYVAGYVEWNDEVYLPKWCPNRIEEHK